MVFMLIPVININFCQFLIFDYQQILCILFFRSFSEIKTSSKGKVFKDWESYPRFLEDLTDNWNWHNLRHRRASIWANNGLTTFEIMVRLGHSNLSTTMKYLQLLGFTRL